MNLLDSMGLLPLFAKPLGGSLKKRIKDFMKDRLKCGDKGLTDQDMDDLAKEIVNEADTKYYDEFREVTARDAINWGCSERYV